MRAAYYNPISIIDIQQAIKGAAGDTIALARLLPRLYLMLKRSYAALIRHIEKGNFSRAKNLARFIRKSAKTLGVVCVAKSAIEIEQAIEGDIPNAVEERIAVMGMALDSFEIEIKRLCVKN